MPIIKSAKKKLRADARKTLRNKKTKDGIKTLIKSMRKSPSAKNLQQIQSVLDKAVKTNLIHKNKASRLKSRLSTLLTSGKTTAAKKTTPKKKVVKKSSKKTSKKK